MKAEKLNHMEDANLFLYFSKFLALWLNATRKYRNATPIRITVNTTQIQTYGYFKLTTLLG